MGAVLPGRGDVTGFWRDLFEGRDLISDVPSSHWLVEDYYDDDPRTKDRTYGRRGGFIDPVAFDPMTFGIPPKAMEGTDTAQLLALIAAQMTLEDIARDSDGKIDKTRTSIVLGVASATELTAHMAGRLQRPAWVNAMRQAGLAETQVQDIAKRIEDHYVEWQEATFPGLLGNVIAGRVANRFDLGGSNYVTDAACASSLSALQIALHELRSGDSDTVLTGGVDALNDILMFMCFSKTPALSPTGDCRPFSTRADGTMLGEAIGMLALRRLDDAERDGNTIHAVIRGLGGASDGKGTAIYSPLPAGQARALRRAYEQAGYGPDSVDLVEAHGTGTKAGDKAEIEGLHMVFDAEGQAEPWCAIGSVKSQIGHTKAAAGAASLIKAVNALSRKVLPPTIKVEEPAEAIRKSPAFYLNTEARPWISAPSRPRRASVSSFGFGGSNFHVTLEEYTGRSAVRPWRTLPAELFLVSAQSPAALAAALDALCTEDVTLSFAGRASATHAEFDATASARCAIVAEDADDLAAKAAALADALRKGEVGMRPLKAGCHASLAPPEAGKVAFMFSGQGSQYVGMGADLAMSFPDARHAWDEAAGHERTGPLKLHRLAFPPAAFDQVEHGDQSDRLKEMQHAQPAIAAVALAQLALLERAGIQADMAAGHSFGEIMALHYAGSLPFAATLTAAADRGALMAEAAQTASGSMIAVQASSEAISGLLDQFEPDLVLANDNGPSQVVLSGPSDIVAEALQACTAAGLKAYMLPVATAFHSRIVAGAVEPFQAALARLKPRKPKRPVYANATAAPYACTAAQLPAEIASQLASSVRFRSLVERMYEDGARMFVEVGPGTVVTGLVNDILGERPHQSVALDNKRANGVAQFLSGIGALCVAGLQADIPALFEAMPAEPVKPTPSKHAVKISGGNYGKPYPPKEGAAGRAPINTAAAPAPHVQQPSAPPVSKPSIPVPPPSPAEAIMSERPQLPASYPAPAAGAADSALERIMLEVSRRHGDYLQATSAAHSAYLQATAQVMTGLPQTVAPSAPVALPQPAPAPSAQPAPAQKHVNGHDGHPPAGFAAPQPAPQAEPPPAPMPVPPPVRQAAPAQPAQTVAAPAPAPKPAPAAAPQISPIVIVTKLIADKTGYPEDMLDPDMDLEGELGVDSIKQVEILSALREQMPELPEIDPERLVELRTISAIADMMAGATPAPKATAAEPPAANGHAANGHANAGNAITADIVRALIAEKTGYPEDMLEDDMDLEGELGVDSIKQVEILSALRDQHPDLPEVDPEELTQLRTIRIIADFFA
ncbi:MAG: acyltransferase domain-containing protein [Hyphomonas sp.]|nr:acyltransferase domain-containing protein [Hyphomonas sp.]